ncbi:MAG TPA: amidohydrolase family protein [Dongiaceae bacterium]|nr:amidohydrolase family protein [Dongiaceae bacterium]
MASREQPATPDLKAFSALAPIDAHAHVFKNDPAFRAMLEHLKLRILDVCVVDKHDRGFEQAQPQNQKAREIMHSTHGRSAWCSTFDPEDFEKPDFVSRSNKVLNETFAQGAVAVKIYKNIGMELKKHDGSYLMPDDPVFKPIFDNIAAHGRTVLAHIAEPTSSWRPLDPANPDYSYYKDNREWFMYLHPERPSKETILAARDRMLAENPKLRVIGCHLGSMEVDVDDIARRFERYPNFAVDTAARVIYLMMQPPEKVRAFLIKYQDRVLYGTDLELMSWSDTSSQLSHWQKEYLRDWEYFATDDWVEYEGKRYRGLKLPETVLRKLYHDNAVHWIDGIDRSFQLPN